ncbi:MAG: mobile mystery protein A [Saprospiraceae bacterium]|nr:mobile mystery protein A [Saprospiraceae bacterium]MBK9109879.1 mobile mystery protein A [Saprospiraceae bacterium]
MGKKALQVQHLSDKMQVVSILNNVAQPPTGWIKATRITLGITLQQLGNKLSISKQSMRDIERREQDGTITIKALTAAAHALDMNLVYGFVPMDGTLEQLIDRKAKELATQIVLRTSNSMKLEDQENSKKRLLKAIEECTTALKNEMPKILWD